MTDVKKNNNDVCCVDDCCTDNLQIDDCCEPNCCKTETNKSSGCC